MLEVYFNRKEESMYFHKLRIKVHCNAIFKEQSGGPWRITIMSIYGAKHTSKSKRIAEHMVDVFVQFRLKTFVKELIQRKYYYTNDDEITEILNITLSLFSNENNDTTIICNQQKAPKDTFSVLFEEIIGQENVIHYDSIMKFRKAQLEQFILLYVGLAIDEFKREEEHQSFLHTLREYISITPIIYQEIHVLQDRRFSFFKSNGQVFSRQELKRIMLQTPLYVVGLHANEWNLAPLIAMAPDKIFIYGNDPTEPKTATVFNVFEEKVQLRDIHAFPFNQHKHRNY